jgi:hypothetical protein
MVFYVITYSQIPSYIKSDFSLYQPFGILVFWRTRRYKSIYNLKIDTIEILIHHSIDAFFFSFKTIWHVVPSTDRKLELKAKTSMAQTASQAAVYAKGLRLCQTDENFISRGTYQNSSPVFVLVCYKQQSHLEKYILFILIKNK